MWIWTLREYPFLSASLHVADALKRTWDTSLNYSVASGKVNIAIRGVRLAFMAIHLFQFRFGATQIHDLYLPEYLANIWPGITCLGFFRVEGPCKHVPVLDIYRLKFELFASLGWVSFYIGAGVCVCVFITHMYLNWVKDDNAVVATIERKLQRRGGDDREEATLVICYTSSNDDERYDDICFIARHGQKLGCERGLTIHWLPWHAITAAPTREKRSR